MFEYKVVKGNALDYKFNPPGKVLIPHVVNSIGIMGSGIALAIKQKWPKAEKEYIDWKKFNRYNILRSKAESGKEIWADWTEHYFELGEVQFVDVGEDVIVANMIGQKNVGENKYGMPPIRMDSLKECIYRLREFVVDNNVVSVASPKFGSLRAGGNWETIEEMIKAIFHNVNVSWFTYEFDEKGNG